MDVTRRLRDSCWPLRAALVSAFLATTTAHAQLGNATAERWRTEQGVDLPGYAVVEPTATSLNIDTVVLACEQTGKSTVLQLQLYLSDDGPLRPLGTSAAELADDPRASISIDAEDYPVTIMFAGDHVLLADDVEGLFPRLSDRLIEAMQAGRTMILQFALLVPDLNRRAIVRRQTRALSLKQRARAKRLLRCGTALAFQHRDGSPAHTRPATA